MRKLKDNILNFLLYTSSFITVGLLVLIVGFIFVNGIKGINLNYIFSDYSPSGEEGVLPMILLYIHLVQFSMLLP